MTRDDVLQKMRERAHYPATARDLARILKIPREQRATFTRHLKSLLASGELVQVRGNRLGLPEKMDLMVGRLQVNPSGFGFVALVFASVNIFGGFLVTQRMLAMYKKKVK